MRYILDLIYLVVAAILSLVRGRPREPVLQPSFLGFPRGGRVWFHGVSVGEIHLLRHVVREFRVRHPGIDCVISSTTETGLAEARKCFANLTVIRWPLDFSWTVDRALRDVRPNLVVLAESELWPNFLLAARRRRVPVVAINVRLSPRSLARYRRFKSLTRNWLALVTHFAVQTREYEAALVELGVEPGRVSVAGSVKYDGLPSDRENSKTAALRRVFGLTTDQVVLIAGSTQAPEEEIALETYVRLRRRYPNLRLILVPRQRDRFDEVAAMLKGRNIEFVRRSELDNDASAAEFPPHQDAIILVDTIGELGAVWGLADIAFVGGSLDGRRGGQNMIEPAAYGAAVLFGPHTWNFRDTVRRLLEVDGACLVKDATELEAMIERLLDDPAERQRLGRAARMLVQSQQGATQRTLDVLGGFLPGVASHTILDAGSRYAS